MRIDLHRQSEHAIVPTYGTDESACFDVYACLPIGSSFKVYGRDNEKRTREADTSGAVIHPGERALIPTGWIFGIPYGYSMRFHPRSGLALKNGISLANAEAVIDSDYTNETFIMICNNSEVQFTVSHGMRLCQGELVPELLVDFIESDTDIRTTDRKGGFGSTGV